MRALHADTGYLLYRLGLHSGQLFNATLEEFGLRLRHYALLRYLATVEGALQRELSDRLGYDPSAIVGLVDDLEKLGLVERGPSPGDRRSRIVAAHRRKAAPSCATPTRAAGASPTNCSPPSTPANGPRCRPCWRGSRKRTDADRPDMTGPLRGLRGRCAQPFRGGASPCGARRVRPPRPALSLTEISRRAGLPLATAHRLVGELTAWGALERDAAGSYHVGLRIWELAALAPRGPALREAALPFLEDLYEATHENVHLAVRDGLDVVYIERLSGRPAVGVRSQVGRPLAAARDRRRTRPPRALRGRFQDRGLRPAARRLHPAHHHRPRPGCAAHSPRCGARACAVSTRQITDDAVSVAAPVRGPADGVVAAAVSVVVPERDAPTPA